MAYFKLIKFGQRAGMQEFVDYMRHLGYEHDASNNQLTFWLRALRSPHRERMIFDLPGVQDPMIERNNTAGMRSQFYNSFYLSPDNVDALAREMANAPDPVADAREELTDRANAKDPALRDGPISIDIPQR